MRIYNSYLKALKLASATTHHLQSFHCSDILIQRGTRFTKVYMQQYFVSEQLVCEQMGLNKLLLAPMQD